MARKSTKRAPASKKTAKAQKWADNAQSALGTIWGVIKKVTAPAPKWVWARRETVGISFAVAVLVAYAFTWGLHRKIEAHVGSATASVASMTGLSFQDTREDEGQDEVVPTKTEARVVRPIKKKRRAVRRSVKPKPDQPAHWPF